MGRERHHDEGLKEAYRVTEAAVVQSEYQYLSILGSIKDLEDNLHQANNTMSLLMNTMPMEWVTSPGATLTAPEMLREEIPMRELAARPDIRAAEESLAAAYYTTAGFARPSIRRSTSLPTEASPISSEAW